jgi:hypothetical protein
MASTSGFLLSHINKHGDISGKSITCWPLETCSNTSENSPMCNKLYDPQDLYGLGIETVPLWKGICQLKVQPRGKETLSCGPGTGWRPLPSLGGTPASVLQAKWWAGDLGTAQRTNRSQLAFMLAVDFHIHDIFKFLAPSENLVQLWICWGYFPWPIQAMGLQPGWWSQKGFLAFSFLYRFSDYLDCSLLLST